MESTMSLSSDSCFSGLNLMPRVWASADAIFPVPWGTVLAETGEGNELAEDTGDTSDTCTKLAGAAKLGLGLKCQSNICSQTLICAVSYIFLCIMN